MSHIKRVWEGRPGQKSVEYLERAKTNCQKLLRSTFAAAVVGLAAIAPLSPSSASAAEPTFKPLSGIGYSPFMNGQQPGGTNYPADASILTDLYRIANIATEIRTYGIDNTLGDIPKLCANVGLYCWPGESLSGTTSDTNTVNSLIAIARSNYFTTRGLIVENESLLAGFPPAQIAAYMSQVKAATPLPITVAEPWGIWTNYAAYSQVITNVTGPFVVDIEPYWEGQPASNAAAYVELRFNQVHAQYPTNQIIAETGWPTGGQIEGVSVPSEANQKLFMDQLTSWANTNLYATDRSTLTNRTMVWYFGYRDENWRTNATLDTEGPVGQFWGLTYASDVGGLTTNKPALNYAMSKALTLNSVTAPNNGSAVTVVLGTSEGDPYTLLGTIDLLRANWIPITNISGTVGTNKTVLQLPSTGAIFTNPAVFLRAEYNFR
jgi:exo-beta-1,3-glucanase (GH17 family)